MCVFCFVCISQKSGIGACHPPFCKHAFRIPLLHSGIGSLAMFPPATIALRLVVVWLIVRILRTWFTQVPSFATTEPFPHACKPHDWLSQSTGLYIYIYSSREREGYAIHCHQAERPEGGGDARWWEVQGSESGNGTLHTKSLRATIMQHVCEQITTESWKRCYENWIRSWHMQVNTKRASPLVRIMPACRTQISHVGATGILEYTWICLDRLEGENCVS